MKRFFPDSTMLNLEKPDFSSDRFLKILVQIKNASAQRGALNYTLSINRVSLYKLSSR